MKNEDAIKALALSGITIAALTAVVVIQEIEHKALRRKLIHISNYAKLSTRIILAQLPLIPDEFPVPAQLVYDMEAFTILTQNDIN